MGEMKEEACFDSHSCLERLRTRSDAANAKAPTLHHSLSAGCSMEDQRVFADGRSRTKEEQEHETTQDTMAEGSKTAHREDGHMVMKRMKSFAKKGAEAVVDP